MGKLWRIAPVAVILLMPLAAAKAQDALDKFTLCNSADDTPAALSACLAVGRDETRPASERAIAYSDAGLDMFIAHDPGAAMTYFKTALALDANSDAAYGARAGVELSTGDYDAAVADAQKAVALKPNGHPEAYLVLGTLADRNGDHEARIAYMNKAIALAPNYAEAYAGRGDGYYSEQKYDLALDDLHKAIDLNPALVPMLRQKFELIYLQRGGLFMTSGNYRAAIDDYSKVLELNPKNVRGLNDRGDAYNMTGEVDRAIADLSQAIDINPSYPFAYANRGVSYFNAGKDDQALADLDRAVSLGDQSASTYFVRGLVYKRKVDRQSALADFQKALDLTPAGSAGRVNIQAAIDSVKN
jgi:tetratricopeptide (TPR) repeat protein